MLPLEAVYLLVSNFTLWFDLFVVRSIRLLKRKADSTFLKMARGLHHTDAREGPVRISMNKRLWLAPMAIAILAARLFLPPQTIAASSTSQGQSGYSINSDVPPSPPQSGRFAPVAPIVPKQFQKPDDLQMPIERQPRPEAQPRELPQQLTTTARVSVTATDGSGRWVPDLNKSDVAIYENDQLRPVLAIQRDNSTPVSIGIVIDTTGSMESKLGAAKAALSHFVETINSNDEAFIIAFSEHPYLLQDFTPDRYALRHTLGLLHPEGRTALYDATLQGLRKVEQGRYRKKALLVITDGIDNVSSHQLGEVIDEARRDGVLVYTVGIGEAGGSGMPRIRMTPFGVRIGIGDSEDERVDDVTLRRLAEDTGANTFIVNPRSGNLGSLDSHFQQISEELREQYTVSFSSLDSGHGATHRLRIESRRPDVVVRGPKYLGNHGMGGEEAAAAD